MIFTIGRKKIPFTVPLTDEQKDRIVEAIEEENMGMNRIDFHRKNEIQPSVNRLF